MAERQAALLAQWMNVGFIHGVMNTDNMTISGETIDYGPCAFMEAYDPGAVFSTIDHQGRYAYANQPRIARWNLARLAEALLPLMAAPDDEAAVRQAVAQVTEVIDAFPALYAAALLRGQRAKLGLQRSDDDAADSALAEDWLALLQAQQVDFTLAWRRLADAAAGDEAPLRALFAEPQAAGRLAGSAGANGCAGEAARRCDARGADALGQPVGDPAQPPRRGGPGSGLGRGRPGALRAAAGRAAPPVRRHDAVTRPTPSRPRRR